MDVIRFFILNFTVARSGAENKKKKQQKCEEKKKTIGSASQPLEMSCVRRIGV